MHINFKFLFILLCRQKKTTSLSGILEPYNLIFSTKARVQHVFESLQYLGCNTLIQLQQTFTFLPQISPGHTKKQKPLKSRTHLDYYFSILKGYGILKTLFFCFWTGPSLVRKILVSVVFCCFVQSFYQNLESHMQVMPIPSCNLRAIL